MDIFSRKVVGWSMAKNVNKELVLNAMTQAINRENPKKGLIVHTDRGSQFTSELFVRYLSKKEFIQSFSRKGNPYDNAVMESFYRTLKRELIRGAHYENHEQAKLEIFKYIETYYNTKRMHSALNYLTPMEFGQKYQN
jgi:putative transposase